jgi:hypothetical protein
MQSSRTCRGQPLTLCYVRMGESSALPAMRGLARGRLFDGRSLGQFSRGHSVIKTNVSLYLVLFNT